MDKEVLSSLAGMYAHGQVRLGEAPETAAPQKQKKIRRFLCRIYKDRIAELPPEIAARLGADRSDGEVLTFLADCHRQMEELAMEKERRFEEAAAALSPAARGGLRSLAERNSWPEPTCRGAEWVTVLEDGIVRRRLIFRDLTGLPAEGIQWFDEVELTKEEDAYRLTLYDCDPGETCVITFTDLSAETETFNALAGQGMEEGPWEYLTTVAWNILDKSRIPGTLNERERDLLPLLAELNGLAMRGHPLPKETEYPLLQKLAAEYGLSDIVENLARLGQIGWRDVKGTRLAKKILADLDRQPCEPLWRRVYEQIAASQADYPPWPFPRESNEMAEIRRRVTDTLREAGYEGEWPDFRKIGPTRGIRLAESYGQTYFVGMEKRVESRIRCEECPWGAEEGVLEFWSGAALLKPGEETEDIFSCLFNAKGRRLFKVTRWPVTSSVENRTPPEFQATVAAKRAEVKRLTKEERRAVKQWQTKISPAVLIVIWLLAGLAFAVFSTAAMALLCGSILFISQPAAEAWEDFKGFPWWQTFLFEWVAFGGGMGLVTLLARKK